MLTSRDVKVVEPESKSECEIEVQVQSFDSVGDSSQISDPVKLEESEQNISKVTSDQDNTEFLDLTHEGIHDETYVPSDDTNADSTLEDADTYHTFRPQRVRKKPERYGFSNLCMNEQTYDDAAGLSLCGALKGPEKEQWRLAMREELQCFKENDAWELCDAPKDSRVVQCKWVLRKKYDSENKVRYRARLVAKGFSQIEGVDYTDTFSPVVRHTTLRLLFALSVQLSLDIVHLDVTTAFLNGTLEETIFMQIPVGFSDSTHSGQVLKLKKAIYGLKQSSRAWYKKVDECLLNIGYVKSKIEPCLYIKSVGSSKTIVTLYVDDFFVFSNNKTETNHLKSMLGKNFVLKDLGIVKECLGMSVNFDKENCSVTLSQEKYIDKLLSKFNMTDCKTVNTPMEVNLKCKKENINCNSQNPYQQLIGSLMYLVVMTRPDIAYAVSYLSQFNNCNTEEHWVYAKRILRYLKKTKNLGLKYSNIKNNNIEGYVDADWSNDVNDRKSYSGFCFMLSGSVISWNCSKQKCISLSSTEAEYVSLSEACKEAVYLRNLQHEVTDRMYTITLYNDSMSAQKLLLNPVFHNKTKHIDVRYHYCREIVNDNIVSVNYLCTSDMPADLFTKSLNTVKHYKHVNALGIVRV